MLDIVGNSYRTCDGVTRRSVVKIGTLGLAGMTVPDLLRLRAAEAAAGNDVPDTAVILLWCGGGPSHYETFDPKPNAPAEYRGPFAAIPTSLPGVNFCELFPRHARLADKVTVIRSCAHKEAGHGSAVKNLNTGYIHPGGTNEGTFLYPTVGSIVAKCREEKRRSMPHSVNVPTAGIFKGLAGGGVYLGAAYDPFAAGPNDGSAILQAPAELSLPRLQNRRKLLASLDQLRRDADARGVTEGMDSFTRQAFEMVTGDAAREALDLSRESDETRARYVVAPLKNAVKGARLPRFAWGEGCLLARRLVEAGVSFVTVGMGSWDDHGKLKEGFEGRAPIYDAAVTALIEDLYERGLDKKVAVLAWGEFGRSPKIDKKGGRGHWPGSMSALVAGGGMQMGQVIGSTNDKGEHPVDRRLHPNDVLATLYRHLGIDHRRAFINSAGRPIPILPHGEPIEELI